MCFSAITFTFLHIFIVFDSADDLSLYTEDVFIELENKMKSWKLS